MNATSRFPFASETISTNNVNSGLRPYDMLAPGTFSSGLGIKTIDHSNSRNNSTSSTTSSPWFTQNNVVAQPVPQMPQQQQQQQQQPPAQQQFRPQQGATAMQWVGPSENSSPKSLTDSSSVYDLSQKLEEKEATVRELKLQVEALMTAIALGKTSEVGSMDGAELVHRMLTRLKSLRSENERLMALASHNHAARLEIELDLLKQENSALRKQLSH